MINLEIIGHLGNDAEKKTFKQGDYISFSVAHTERYKDAQGENKSTTTWVNCLYKYNGGTLINYLKKGTLVYVCGKPKATGYSTKSGDIKSDLCLNAFKIELLGGQSSDNENKNKNDQSQSYDPEDDIPF